MEKRKDTEPHIGNIIKQELQRQGRSITWLASQINCSRENLYKIFRRSWIHTDMLLRICDALNYDFFKVYSNYRNRQSVN
ncbi:MAG: helix-turn-helix transcriptional regulator [Bacteroidales bacterium]|nr:helix-turn-helix transcriptional regulator [Bacteroidales bacterium]